MAKFFIKTQPTDGTDPEIFALTVASEFTINHTGTPTSHPVQQRQSRIDNYVSQNDTMSITGLISDIKNLSLVRGGIPQTGVQQTIQNLEALKNSRNLFTVHFDDRFSEKKNCLFNNLIFSTNASVGTGYNVSMTITQIQVSDSVTFETLTRVLDTIKTQHSEAADQGDNSTNSKTMSESLSAIAIDKGFDFFGLLFGDSTEEATNGTGN